MKSTYIIPHSRYRSNVFKIPSPPTISTAQWGKYPHEEKKKIATHYGCYVGHFEDTYLQLGNALAASEYKVFASEANAAVENMSVQQLQSILAAKIASQSKSKDILKASSTFNYAPLN